MVTYEYVGFREAKKGDLFYVDYSGYITVMQAVTGEHRKRNVVKLAEDSEKPSVYDPPPKPPCLWTSWRNRDRW